MPDFEVPTDELRALIVRQKVLADQLKLQEDAVAKTLAMLDFIELEAIPDEMDRLHLMGDVTPFDGIEIVRKKKVHKTGIVKGKQAWAHAWLEDEGHGALIKNSVVVPFDRGRLTEAEALLNRLEREGFFCTREAKIESSTLRKMIVDQLEDGAGPPQELFHYRIERRATVRRPDGE